MKPNSFAFKKVREEQKRSKLAANRFMMDDEPRNIYTTSRLTLDELVLERCNTEEKLQV